MEEARDNSFSFSAPNSGDAKVNSQIFNSHQHLHNWFLRDIGCSSDSSRHVFASPRTVFQNENGLNQRWTWDYWDYRDYGEKTLNSLEQCERGVPLGMIITSQGWGSEALLCFGNFVKLYVQWLVGEKVRAKGIWRVRGGTYGRVARPRGWIRVFYNHWFIRIECRLMDF